LSGGRIALNSTALDKFSEKFTKIEQGRLRAQGVAGKYAEERAVAALEMSDAQTFSVTASVKH
jgi:hypothetical protein